MQCGQTPGAFESMVEHLAIPPIPPPTQSILATPVRNEHDARLDRRRGVDRMDLVDSLVTRCSAIQGWIIAVLYVVPRVLDGMMYTFVARHRRQEFGFDSDCPFSASKLSSPHRRPREALVRQEPHLVADRKVASPTHDTDARGNTLEQAHNRNHVSLTRRTGI